MAPHVVCTVMLLDFPRAFLELLVMYASRLFHTTWALGDVVGAIVFNCRDRRCCFLVVLVELLLLLLLLVSVLLILLTATGVFNVIATVVLLLFVICFFSVDGP